MRLYHSRTFFVKFEQLRINFGRAIIQITYTEFAEMLKYLTVLSQYS